MTVQPLHDRVLVRPAAANDVTPGGILLPDVAQEKPLRGEVIAVGPGKFNTTGLFEEMSLHVGDIVLYGRYGSQEIKETGEGLLIMRESDIFATLVD